LVPFRETIVLVRDSTFSAVLNSRICIQSAMYFNNLQT
jgi:hypothetical protein